MGKTQIARKITGKSFLEVHVPTEDLESHTVTDMNHELLIWDSSSQYLEHSHEIYILKKLSVCILVFDTSDSLTFKNLTNKFILNIKKNFTLTAEILLIGNKSDKPERQVTIDEAESWALENDAFYLDFSAKKDARFVIISKLDEIIEKLNS